jgi:hypothetical protein
VIYDWMVYILAGMVVLLAIFWIAVFIRDARWAWRTRDADWNRRRRR